MLRSKYIIVILLIVYLILTYNIGTLHALGLNSVVRHICDQQGINIKYMDCRTYNKFSEINYSIDGLLHLKTANDFLKIKNYEKALNEYNKAIESDPNDGLGYLGRANLYFLTRQFERAKQDYETVLSLSFQLDMAYFGRARVYYAEGNTDEALADLDRSLHETPLGVGPLEARSIVLIDQGKFELALIDLDKAISINPNVANDYFRRGQVKYYLQRFKEAASDFGEAIKLESDRGDYFVGRALALANSNQISEALLDINIARNLNPTDAYTLVWFITLNMKNPSWQISSLKPITNKINNTTWPYQILETLMGDMSLPTLKGLALNDDQKCDVSFVEGELALAELKNETAVNAFKAALSYCKSTLLITGRAKYELSAIPK